MFVYYRTEERAAGWYRLTREILKLPEAPSNSKDKSQKTRRPQPLIKLVMRRFINIFPFPLFLWWNLTSLCDCFERFCYLKNGIILQPPIVTHLSFSHSILHRLESSFRSFSRPVLHAAARVVQEMGKSRAAAHAVGLPDLDEGAYVDTQDSLDSDTNDNSNSEGNAIFII